MQRPSSAKKVVRRGSAKKPAVPGSRVSKRANNLTAEMYEALGSVYTSAAVASQSPVKKEKTGYVLVDPKGKKYEYMDSIYADIPKYNVNVKTSEVSNEAPRYEVKAA